MEQPRASIRRFDVVLTVAMYLSGLAVIQASHELGPPMPGQSYPGWPATVVLLAGAVGPTAVRRRFPVSSLLVTTGFLIAVRLFHVPEGTVTSVALLLGLHAAGRWGRAPHRTAARAVSVGLLLVALALAAVEEYDFVARQEVSEPAYYLAWLAGVAFNLAFLGVGWWLGDLDRIRADRERELTVRTLELELEREERARRAVLTERLRIAREIHDVVAHHVSVMGIQAGAARRLAAADPARVAEPLLAIEGASRDAVGELQRLLLFLRSDDRPAPLRQPASRSDPALAATPPVVGSGSWADGGDGVVGSGSDGRPAVGSGFSADGDGRSGVGSGSSADGVGEDRPDRRPVPGLEQLPRLRRQVADAGLACSLERVGEERPLPSAVDLSAYRIIQESLTNVLKHTHARAVGVSLSVESSPARFVLSVADDGGGFDPGSAGTGRGLSGMRRRAEQIGATLEVVSGAQGTRVVLSYLLPAA